jgi:hypothetical protein
MGGTGRERGLVGGVGWGTEKELGIVTGCPRPDTRSWAATAAIFCASATSSPVLNAEVGVGGARGFLGAAGSTGSCTVGPVESLGGAGGGTLR